MRLTPCVDVPSFFSPSRGSRSAESLWRNWIACFSLLCCLRAAASAAPGSPRFSVRIPVNMLHRSNAERFPWCRPVCRNHLRGGKEETRPPGAHGCSRVREVGGTTSGFKLQNKVLVRLFKATKRSLFVHPTGSLADCK